MRRRIRCRVADDVSDAGVESTAGVRQPTVAQRRRRRTSQTQLDDVGGSDVVRTCDVGASPSPPTPEAYRRLSGGVLARRIERKRYAERLRRVSTRRRHQVRQYRRRTAGDEVRVLPTADDHEFRRRDSV